MIKTLFIIAVAVLIGLAVQAQLRHIEQKPAPAPVVIHVDPPKTVVAPVPTYIPAPIYVQPTQPAQPVPLPPPAPKVKHIPTKTVVAPALVVKAPPQEAPEPKREKTYCFPEDAAPYIGYC